MSSSKSRDRFRLVAEIEKFGFPASFACDHCLRYNRLCIVMMSGRHSRCSECVRLGRKCSNMSWESLDKTRDEFQKKVDDDEALLAEVMARLLRNKKILRQAEERAKVKAGHLAAELSAEDGLSEDTLDCPASAIGVALSPAMWQTMDLLDGFLDVGSSVPEKSSAAVGSSSGS